MKSWLITVPLVAMLASPTVLLAQQASRTQSIVQPGGDIPKDYAPVVPGVDFDRREVMIPMRDGVKLYTVILIPKGAANAPIVLNRTPYNAAARGARTTSGSMLNALAREDTEFVQAGYIRVWQDIRGKYGSEGDYVVTRPVVGPLNATGVDHATDAYDTIEWLVSKANLPESNGRVGIIGSSYEGTTAALALLDPHPALKVAAPESPLIDAWMGDDWFHYGAFRQKMADYIAQQTGAKAIARSPSRGGYDDYENFLAAGSAGAWGSARGYDQLPFWRRLVEHPTYDAVWQGLAIDKLLAKNPSDVPTLWVQPLWDQEDSYGAITSFEALRSAGKTGNNHLVLGPWFHSHVNVNEGRSLGPLTWGSDTVTEYWREMVLPFFNQYLKDGPAANLPVAIAYNTGENRWEHLPTWPLACEQGCATPLTPIYLDDDRGLGFRPGAAGGDRYVSDPATPVPYLPRPVNFDDALRWYTWLVSDQRGSDGRPDVMTYQTAVLTEPVRVAGAPIADIFARTTGTDGDFVVKVIDVYPAEIANDPKMGGYQLAISLDIFRGRYRESFEKPSAIPSGKVQRYKFRLPTVNHVFQPGHRIMIQVQSSLFPLYDRNPQTYVPNIFNAKKSDYKSATVTLERGGQTPSRVWLPIVPVDQSRSVAP